MGLLLTALAALSTTASRRRNGLDAASVPDAITALAALAAPAHSSLARIIQGAVLAATSLTGAIPIRLDTAGHYTIIFCAI
jgi:ABC-type methionine transport system permease subunit